MMDPCASISTRPEVLSVENIAKVRNRLASLGGLSRPMEECLDHALLTFSREAGCLQENARLVICCEKQQLEFISGQGESNIEVSYVHGVPCYAVQLPSFNSPVERLPSGVLVLSLENLDKVITQMFSWREMTNGLKSCLARAKNGLSRESQCIQDNAKMVVKSDGRLLVFMSGEGANTINVSQLPDGNIDYSINLLSWWDKIVRHFTAAD